MTAPMPTPKELVIRQQGEALTIYTSTSDARQWIEREAPKFGGTFPLFDGNAMVLYIQSIWNVAEVVAYLNSYNEAE